MENQNNLKNTKPFVKRFEEWFKLKPKIDGKNSQPPSVKEREVYWCSLGENVGSEISGKNKSFERPVIIYKKLGKYNFLVIPCSTKNKTGSFYSSFVFDGVKNVACLNQVRVIDYRRLINHEGTITSKAFNQIKKDFGSLYR